MPSFPILGNCLLGTCWIKLRYGGEVRKVKQKGTNKRHTVVQLPTGEVWHFRATAYLLPWMFRYWLFVGRFEQLARR